MTDAEKIGDLETEVTLLRAALLPFAQVALTREGQNPDVPDTKAVAVPMGACRGAQRAMAA